MTENKSLIKQSFNLSCDYKKLLYNSLKDGRKTSLGWTYLKPGEMYIMTKFVLI